MALPNGDIVVASDSDGLPVLAAILTAPPGQKTPDITWANPADINYGTALGATQLDASASSTSGGTTVNVPGSFRYTLAAGTVLGAGGNQALSVSFTPADTTASITRQKASCEPSVSIRKPTLRIPLQGTAL